MNSNIFKLLIIYSSVRYDMRYLNCMINHVAQLMSETLTEDRHALLINWIRDAGRDAGPEMAQNWIKLVDESKMVHQSLLNLTLTQTRMSAFIEDISNARTKMYTLHQADRYAMAYEEAVDRATQKFAQELGDADDERNDEGESIELLNLKEAADRVHERRAKKKQKGFFGRRRRTPTPGPKKRADCQPRSRFSFGKGKKSDEKAE